MSVTTGVIIFLIFAAAVAVDWFFNLRKRNV